MIDEPSSQSLALSKPGTFILPIRSILLILSKPLCLCVSVAKTEILILLFSLVHPVKASPARTKLIEHFLEKNCIAVPFHHHSSTLIKPTKSHSNLLKTLPPTSLIFRLTDFFLRTRQEPGAGNPLRKMILH